MTWVLILLIAIVVFAVLAFVLKMPRSGWELTGAALLFGIAGYACLLYTSPSPRDLSTSRMPSSA